MQRGKAETTDAAWWSKAETKLRRTGIHHSNHWDAVSGGVPAGVTSLILRPARPVIYCTALVRLGGLY